MLSKVAIFGDSWAVSSYIKEPNLKEKLGNMFFQDLFKKINILAVNLATHGSSNQDIINKIHNNQNIIDSTDLIIVFQTDPIRNVLNQQSNKFELRENIVSKFNTLNEFSEDICQKFYFELSKINKPVLLIGGLSKLCLQLIPKNINFLEKSWTELVDTNFKDCYYEWVDPTLYVHNQLNLDKKEFFEIEKIILQKNYIWQQSEKFSWCHPGDQAYNIMFEEIKNKIKEY